MASLIRGRTVATASVGLVAALACAAPAVVGGPEAEPGRAISHAGRGWSDTRPASGPAVEHDGRWMVPYTETVPGGGATFRMTPVPGGVVLLGSPADEPGREDDEGPQRRVVVGPRWVGVHEVTWREFHAYMNLYEPLKKLDDVAYQYRSASGEGPLVGAVQGRPALEAYFANADAARSEMSVDAVTCPTPLYDASFTYEPGKAPDQPAVTMTQYTAKQYTKWLSGGVGRDYRLPTGAEWEHAARADTTAAYSFGDDPADLNDHAWYFDNADDKTQPVGRKLPNPWGLHDVHGNVAEWVLDQYDAEHYASLSEAEPTGVWDALRRPDSVWPRAYRGGSWQDDPETLRSAARRGSLDEEWKLSDPSLPASPWWYTEYESQGVGFRVMRPADPMTAEEREISWEADVDDLRYDVEDRLMEGRGVQGRAFAGLGPAVEAIKDLESDNE